MRETTAHVKPPCTFIVLISAHGLSPGPAHPACAHTQTHAHNPSPHPEACSSRQPRWDRNYRFHITTLKGTLGSNVPGATLNVLLLIPRLENRKGFRCRDGTKGGAKQQRKDPSPGLLTRQTSPGKENSPSSPCAQPCSLHPPQSFQSNRLSLLTSELSPWPWEARMSLACCLWLCTKQVLVSSEDGGAGRALLDVSFTRSFKCPVIVAF